MKNKIFTIILSIVILSQIFLINADTIYTKDNPITSAGKSTNAQFAIQTLKYEPFPVNPGDYFDVWIMVQNIGQDQANDVNFKFDNNYPFTTEDSVRSFSVIPGTSGAHDLKLPSDNAIEANQVVLKYRVKVAEDSPVGENKIKLEVTTNDNKDSITYNIPIDVRKTKTDFDVKINDLSPQESTLIVTNDGDNNAKAVIVDIKNQNGLSILNGYIPSSLGDINQGDFTLAHMKVVPQKDTKEITIEISYTDTSGVRSKVEKIIPIDGSNLQNICVESSKKDYLNYVYAAIGFVTGAFIIILISLFMQKARSKKHKKIN